MALVLRKIMNFYDQAIEEWRDTRVDDWFLMNSLWPLLVITGCYLYFVLNLGPTLMKDRKPFNVKNLLVVYNAIQVIYCFILTIMLSIYIIPYYNILCEACDYSMSPRGIMAAKLCWWYFLLKMIDLLDTVFVVLKKNNRQVSFLHVYHHTAILIGAWIGVKFIAGGSSAYVGFYNCIVHMIMYAYYLASILDSSYSKNIWIKKQVTRIQLLQFLILTVIYSTPLISNDCKCPTWVSVVYLPQQIFMLYMFGDFYIKQYVLPTKKVNTKET